MITDPIADLITRIKNAGAIGKESVQVPYSNLKFAVAKKLREAGYITSAEKNGKKEKPFIEVMLRYDKSGVHVIQDVKRISKPGRRLYRSVRDIVPVRYGTGSLFMTTPRGIMTDKEARKEKVGGEALFEIW